MVKNIVFLLLYAFSLTNVAPMAYPDEMTPEDRRIEPKTMYIQTTQPTTIETPRVTDEYYFIQGGETSKPNISEVDPYEKLKKELNLNDSMVHKLFPEMDAQIVEAKEVESPHDDFQWLSRLKAILQRIEIRYPVDDWMRLNDAVKTYYENRYRVKITRIQCSYRIHYERAEEDEPINMKSTRVVMATTNPPTKWKVTFRYVGRRVDMDNLKL